MSRPLNATAAERIFVSLNTFLPQPNDRLDTPDVTRAKKTFLLGFIAECKALGVGFVIRPAHLYTFGAAALKELGLHGARLFFHAQLHDDPEEARYVMEWARDELDVAYITFMAGRASPSLGRDISWGETPEPVAVYASQRQRNCGDMEYSRDHYKRLNGVTVAEDIVPLALHAHNGFIFNHLCAMEDVARLRAALSTHDPRSSNTEDTLFVPVFGPGDRTTPQAIPQALRDGADCFLLGDRIFNNGPPPADWVNLCLRLVEEASQPAAEAETAEEADS